MWWGPIQDRQARHGGRVETGWCSGCCEVRSVHCTASTVRDVLAVPDAVPAHTVTPCTPLGVPHKPSPARRRATSRCSTT